MNEKGKQNIIIEKRSNSKLSARKQQKECK